NRRRRRGRGHWRGHGSRPQLGRMNMRSNSLSRYLAMALAAASAAQVCSAEELAAPRSLFADRRAHASGDVLTVLISEVASVSATAQTKTNKSESANANLLQHDGEMQLANVGIEGKFAGGGQIERSGTLLARLSVRIDSVDSNGNLLVSGEQLIVINNE